MLDPTSALAGWLPITCIALGLSSLPRPWPLILSIVCIGMAVTMWPCFALADDPSVTVVTTGIPVVDAILKLLGALYVLISMIVLILPKTSKLAELLAKLAADLKGVVPQAAARKEAMTGEMAARMKRESTIPPPAPRGFANVSVLLGVSLAAVAFGVWAGCKTNAARTACDVVHIIDDGCETFVEVPLPDGTTEKVPRSEIVKLAKATKAMRLGGAR